MMEEVSIAVAYDAHIVDQMSEEEILACLVAKSKPKQTAPVKKAKLRASQHWPQKEDPIDRYLRENHELQQASLRLEQENDSLAHRLVTSKISLRNALDQTEDQVDEIAKELFKSRKLLQETQGEKRAKEEEAAMLKEVFQRELEKAQLEVMRSSGIITDYKQICSRLTSQLEKQQCAERVELDALKSAVQACSCCTQLLNTDIRPTSSDGTGSTDTLTLPTSGTVPPDQHTYSGKRLDKEKESLRAQVQELEKELVQTKLQMVEATCRIQELEHQRGVLTSDLQASKKNWFNKTLTTLRTAGGGLQGGSVPWDGDLSLEKTLNRGPLSAWSSRSTRRSLH
ncbi:rab GTPase-activating protein 1-like [Osmerus eperlanus]|uniref:rab GTPase-activating protein 1-like n=1 Tax=Osmerus eperlanus TaxID=29151 RepID=UPI002E12F17B